MHLAARRTVRTTGLRRALLLLALVAIFFASARLTANLTWTIGGPPLVGRLPDRSPGAPAQPASCLHDPSHLPSPPPGPDGRPANYLHTCGNRLYDSHGRPVKITGLNWSGMETSDFAPDGLGNRNWQALLDQIAALGYNTIRVPFSDETLAPGSQLTNVNFTLNPDLEGLTGLQMLDRLVAGARARGLKVILDRHQPTANGPTELWYDDQVSQAQWIADWQMLAARYRGDDTVIGVDLANEPHGPATWGTGDPATDWRLAAERAGNAVLAENPYLLIFVEGIGTYQGDRFWWGGNLEGAGPYPVRLQVPNRLVYSPHDYGPQISDQPWFHSPSFPRNLPSAWDQHWGYLAEQQVAPVVLGEFGGWSFGTDAEGQWQRTLLAYLRAHDLGFLVWQLGSSWDTGGILEPDWRTADPEKRQAYRPLLAAPLATGPTGVFGRAPTRFQVLLRPDAGGPSASDVHFSFRIYNDGPDPVPLSDLELRYYFQGGPALVLPTVSVAAGALAGASPRAAIVPTTRGGQGYEVRVDFAPGSGTIAHYRETGTVDVQFSRPGAAAVPVPLDYSAIGTASGPTTFQPWTRVTLYDRGKLAWGRAP
jgi:endoglucanase